MIESFQPKDQLRQSYTANIGEVSSSPSTTPKQVRRVLLLTMTAGMSTSALVDDLEQLRFSALPQSSTTLSSPPSLRPVRMGQATNPLRNTAEQLRDVQECFGLNKTQLARACKVQRQTVYDWFARKFEAEDSNAQRLAELTKVASDLMAEGALSLNARAASRTLSSGETLMELLEADRLDRLKLRSAHAALSAPARRPSAPGARDLRNRFGWSAPTEERTRDILRSNLDDLSDG